MHTYFFEMPGSGSMDMFCVYVSTIKYINNHLIIYMNVI